MADNRKPHRRSIGCPARREKIRPTPRIAVIKRTAFSFIAKKGAGFLLAKHD
jgi:hypothetical protein